MGGGVTVTGGLVGAGALACNTPTDGVEFPLPGVAAEASGFCVSDDHGYIQGMRISSYYRRVRSSIGGLAEGNVVTGELSAALGFRSRLFFS